MTFQYLPILSAVLFFFLFLILFIYFREGKGGKEREKHQCVVASHAPLIGDLARNPGMCPDPLVHRLALNPLSHSSHGSTVLLFTMNVTTNLFVRALDLVTSWLFKIHTPTFIHHSLLSSAVFPHSLIILSFLLYWSSCYYSLVLTHSPLTNISFQELFHFRGALHNKISLRSCL